MKLKQFLYITDPAAYLNGSKNCYAVTCRDNYQGKKFFEDWILVGEIEIEVKLSEEAIKHQMVRGIDAEVVNVRAEFQGKLDVLKERKEKLLAITHQA